LQYTAPHCNAQAARGSGLSLKEEMEAPYDDFYTATHCDTLPHAATLCNTLQHTAIHCNTLQHTAIHCNTQAARGSELSLKEQMEAPYHDFYPHHCNSVTKEARCHAPDGDQVSMCDMTHAYV